MSDSLGKAVGKCMGSSKDKSFIDCVKKDLKKSTDKNHGSDKGGYKDHDHGYDHDHDREQRSDMGGRRGDKNKG